MTVTRGLRRVAKVGVLAVPVCLALTPGTAFADTANVNATFQAQYQQNANEESQLMNEVNSISSPNWQTRRLEYIVRFLNYRVQMYYTAEQRLAGILGNSGTVASPGNATLSNLMSERNQLESQVMSAWKSLMSNESANIPPGRGHHDGWDNGRGKKGPKGPTIGSMQNMLTQNPGQAKKAVREYLSSLKSNDDDGRFAKNGGANQSLSKYLGNVSQLLQKLAQVDDSIIHNRRHHSGDDDGHNSTRRLANLQKRVLSLQADAIRDLDKILTMNGKTPTTNPQPSAITHLAVTSNETTVTEGKPITYTAQLLNSANQPIQQAGVQINFTLVNGRSDGSLTSTSAVTNNNGQASVQVNAGNSVGTVQATAVENGVANVTGSSPVVNVVSPAPAGTATKLVAAGASFPTTLITGQSTGTASDVLPETASGTVVSGDTLQITTSNPNVLALPSPSSTNASVQTLPTGDYVLPALAAKSVGSAVVTVTDITGAQHPSMSFTVTVNSGSASQLVVINPNGSENTPYSVGAGVDGPFQIAVVNSAGAMVPSPTTITLTAQEVTKLIGAGTAIRPALSSNDVPSVMIPAGKTSVSVYADNVTAGATKPTTMALKSLTPSLTSAAVTSNHTLVLTFSTDLNQPAPSPTDFNVSWTGGQQTPQSVVVSGDTLTISLWGTPLAHGDTVDVSYTAGSDANPLTSVFGAKAADFSNQSVSNPL